MPWVRSYGHGQQRAREAALPRPPSAESDSRREVQAQSRRLQVPGSDPAHHGIGEARQALTSGKETQWAAPVFAAPRARGFRVAGPPLSPRLARRLFVSPRLPSSQTNGCRQEIGRAPGEPRSSARRGGGAARRLASGGPSRGGGGGGCFDISSKEGT